MALKPKGFQQFLEDDPTLKNPIDYNELGKEERLAANNDISVQEAYSVYSRKCTELGKL